MNSSSRTNRCVQTYLSMTILLALVIVAAGVLRSQFTYNPAVLNVETMLPPTQGSAGIRKAAGLQPFFGMPEGLVAMSEGEVFDAENLSDKIDGKAELYLAAGFVGLNTQRFTGPEAGPVWMEAFVYHMGNPANAFAVYSSQRREDAQPLDVTPYAYQTPNAVFLAHGPYYLEIIASQATEAASRSMQFYAQRFTENVRVGSAFIRAENIFPSPDLVENSITLVASDAFGFDRLDQVYTATYNLEGSELMAFFSNRHTAAQALELAALYHEFLSSFGGREIEIDVPIQGVAMVNIVETYEVIFSVGPYIVGVREAEDKNQAQELALRLHKRLKEVAGEL